MTELLHFFLVKIDTEQEKTKLLDDIPEIIEQIRFLLEKIKRCNSFSESQIYFDYLMTAHDPIGRMPFMYDLKVGKSLGKFITDFDRIDDLETREIIYKEIKDGTYSLDS